MEAEKLEILRAPRDVLADRIEGWAGPESVYNYADRLIDDLDRAGYAIGRKVDDSDEVCSFALYRPNPPADYIEKGAAVEADKPQLYGTVFPDGTTVIRWMTMAGSVAIFPTFEDFQQIHGHPEYGTRIEWQ